MNHEPRTMNNKLKHILVIRLSAMGDVAMTVPVLRAFTEQHPEVKLTVLTRPFFAPFFEGLKNVAIFPADVKGKYKGVLGLYKLSKAVQRSLSGVEMSRSHRVDAIADLHNVLRSKILKSFFRGLPKTTIDKGRKEKRALISGKNFQQLKTTHQRYTDVFEKLGYTVDLSNPTFPEKRSLNNNILKVIGTDQLQWIGIAPFAAHQGKMYPLDLMAKVISELSKDHKILLFGGGKSEQAQLVALEKQFNNTVNLAGKLSLKEELDVISNLDVMLSMDSGNAHMAAMLGVKTVTLWGVTHPYAGFAPFNQPTDHALLSDRTQFPLIPTSVYGNKLPKGYEEVMRSIAPETVVKKLLAVV